MRRPIYNAIHSLFCNPAHFVAAVLYRIGGWIPDKLYLRIIYRLEMGKTLHLDNPLTFNEKLQWLKLYNRKPEYTMMVDKVAVKDYVASIIGQEYIIPTLGVWDSPNDIEWDKLPNQFVLKTNHDGGSNGIVVCKDKATLNKRAALRELKHSFNRNSYLIGREWPYKNVPRKIMAEKYLEDSSGELRDYKFFCFNGKVRCYKMDFNRLINHRANYYDREGRLLSYGEVSCLPDLDTNIMILNSIPQMIELAEKLAEKYPCVRVDFYSVNGKIYFGEITFFPAGGMSRWVGNVDVDALWGGWLTLPEPIS